MIFKKQALQGGAILSNGERIDFDSNSLFETEDPVIIAQLAPIYEEFKGAAPAPVKAEAPGAKAVTTGMASSATIAPVTKAQ